MLLDMIHDNHGEPPFRTRYRDPALLASRGYEAIVIPDALTALPGAYVERGSHEKPAGAQSRHPHELEQAIDNQVKAAVAAGMKIFFYGDALLLPLAWVSRHPSRYYCDDGSGRLCPGKPAVYEGMQQLARQLFIRWPQAAGLVIRTGEVYPEATPHMTGSPLHVGTCPLCREIPVIDRLVRFIRAMHDAVIVENNRIYVHRAWQPPVAGLPNMHDDPLVYRQVADQVPQSDRLTFSFKFTRGDFRRGQSFNPCLTLDDRPRWIEFQCEREYEGKGALPNYQGPLWRAFLEQLMNGRGMSADEIRGRFGIWGWSRGGGWGGPYVQREEWIDANVHALAALYRQPDADPAEIASAWVAEAFAVPESSPPAPALAELLSISSPVIRKLLYVSALTNGNSGGQQPWLRDDQLDIPTIYVTAQQVMEHGLAADALAEKREAIAGVDRIRHLFDLASQELPGKSQSRDLANCLAYYHSFAGSVAHAFMGFVRFCAWEASHRQDPDLAAAAKEHLEAAQFHWQLHTQRHVMLPGAPSMFHENGLWERTNACLAEIEDATEVA
jgi:hypothetical protein